jgi:hypothetical protein
MSTYMYTFITHFLLSFSTASIVTFLYLNYRDCKEKEIRWEDFELKLEKLKETDPELYKLIKKY